MLEFPRWKYIVILLVLLISAVYSLPNLYPKDPSVQVSANRGAATGITLRQQVEAGIAASGLKPKAVEMDGDDTVMVRLSSTDQQTQLQDALRDTLGQDYSVALNLLPTVPKWLDSIGAKPMSLGLDLQGGIHFLMQVEQQAAIQKRMEAYAENMRGILRDGRIKYRSVDVRPDHSVNISFEQGTDPDVAQAALIKGLGTPAAGGPGFTWSVDNGNLSASLSDAEINKIAVDAVDQNRTVIAERINALGVAEPVLQRQGADRLVIQLPGLQDTAEAKRQIGATATLEFRAVTGDEAEAAAAKASGQVPPDSRIYDMQSGGQILLSKRVLVSGDQLLSAVPGVDPQSGSPDVSITLNAAGGKRMLDHTIENVGKRLGIVYIERIPTVTMVDGKEVQSSRVEERVISASTIQSPFGNQFHTTGLAQEEAQSLAKQLKSGALAAPMFFADQRTVGPSLGKENVERGTKAVAFAFLFTLGFFLIYYRMFGVVTCLALLMNLLMVVAVLSLFGATMTLPGFAGLALTVAMSVDANVLINERIREELRAGMPPKAAIATGYDKASGTIFDANMTALLAGIALYAFGTGPLKGFALTMVIGILTSVFTAVTVSRALATLIYGGRKKLKSIAI